MLTLSDRAKWYYLRRLYLFWYEPRIADEIGVSIMTLRRWNDRDARVNPTVRHTKGLERALRRLVRELKGKALSDETQFYKHVAEALEFEDPVELDAQESRKNQRSFRAEQELATLLKDHKTVKSTHVYKVFSAMGFSRMQVNYAAKKLKVKKTIKKFGPKGYSEWSMP